MKKSVIWGISAVALFFVGCVEKTQKYKDLLSRADSLNQVVLAQNEEMEQMFADINDITLGMQSLREAEQLLLLETEKEESPSKSKQQLNRLKKDVLALKEAIAGYKLQIAKLNNRSRVQSEEFKRMINYLNAELALRDEKIESITQQLVRKNKELTVKSKEVEKLTQNMKQLNKTSKGQKMIIAEQDQRLHQAHYLIGSRKALKEAKVISRQGIFAPLIVSLQTQNADFINIDIREIVSIPLNEKKAKVLSTHPKESYALVADDEGNLILKINDVKSFWKQTRYLVVMVD